MQIYASAEVEITPGDVANCISAEELIKVINIIAQDSLFESIDITDSGLSDDAKEWLREIAANLDAIDKGEV